MPPAAESRPLPQATARLISIFSGPPPPRIRRRNCAHIGHRPAHAENRSLLRLPNFPFLIRDRDSSRSSPSAVQKRFSRRAKSLVSRPRKHMRDPIPIVPRPKHRHRLDIARFKKPPRRTPAAKKHRISGNSDPAIFRRLRDVFRSRRLMPGHAVNVRTFRPATTGAQKTPNRDARHHSLA